MPEIVMHVFDKTTGKELSQAKAFTSNTRTFGYDSDKVLTADSFASTDPTRASRIGRTLKQDFIARIASLKSQASNSPPCTKDNCLWCKKCFNIVAIVLGRQNQII